MRLWEGKEPQELLKRLHELDELTGIDSVIQPGQKVTVTATAYGSGLSRWTVDADDAAYRAPKIASGSKFDQFCAAFEGMTEELEADIYSVRVLAYADTQPYRTYDGKFTTRWFSIDPLDPYNVDKKTGQPVFKFEELVITQEEYRMMMGTKLAIRAGDAVYALLRDALMSTGRLLLDSSSVFKRSDENALGCGMMLAEALADRDSLKALTRGSGRGVRPLLAVMGSRYRYIPQSEFFKEVFKNIAGFGIYLIEKWSITDELTTVQAVLQGDPEYQKGFLITASDFNGTPMKVSAFGRFPNGAMVVLKQSSMLHNKASVDRGVKCLFDGMEEAFGEFDQFIEDMDVDAVFDAKAHKKWLRNVQDLIGMRRCRVPETLECNGLALAMTLAKDLDADIRDRNGLLYSIWNLLLDIRGGCTGKRKAAV